MIEKQRVSRGVLVYVDDKIMNDLLVMEDYK
jgi:hypothetical protein